MKKAKNHKTGNLFILFLQFFGTVFAGLSLCNIFAVTMDCVFDGFADFLLRISELPYLLFAGLSFIISLALILILCKWKT